MKTRIGVLILFICMFVACSDINNSFKQETVTVGLQEYVVGSDFQVWNKYKGDRKAITHFHVSIKDKTTVVVITLSTRQKLLDFQQFIYPQDSSRIETSLADYVSKDLLTQAEQDFCIDNAHLVHTNNSLLNK